ncbi:hypothetical protein [Burkholderia ambifaria]|uniref:hypothetical protein n=1 Tax=Burkholderia ambifaria TaxID=152480 RepID=UPI00158D91C8|nr:hypothetical protein [Burkholderia ambifaria]
MSEVGWAAELQRAGGMPNQRVVADCAEKKKGVTEKFRNPFFGFGAAAGIDFAQYTLSP